MESFESDILGLGDKSEEFSQDASGLKNSIKHYFDARERLEADDLLPEGQRMSKEARSELVREKDRAYSAVTEAREFRNANLNNKDANANAQALAELYERILSAFDQINTAAAKRTTSEQEYISLAQQDAKLQE
jgi:molecular chaperone GrpE (heat shock protein)